MALEGVDLSRRPPVASTTRHPALRAHRSGARGAHIQGIAPAQGCFETGNDSRSRTPIRHLCSAPSRCARCPDLCGGCCGSLSINRQPRSIVRGSCDVQSGRLPGWESIRPLGRSRTRKRADCNVQSRLRTGCPAVIRGLEHAHCSLDTLPREGAGAKVCSQLPVHYYLTPAARRAWRTPADDLLELPVFILEVVQTTSVRSPRDRRTFRASGSRCPG